MNKYLLTFKNPLIEEKYQSTSIGQIRMTMFTLISLGCVVVLIVRIVQGLLQQNYFNVYTYIAMLIYCVVQYLLSKKYKQLLRPSLILFNHAFTIYFLFVEESSDSLSGHLRGANQMGSNFLIILAGEYIDAMFSLVSISIIRIIIIFIKSTSIEYSAITLAIIVILFASKYLYQYHKAIRSQFLLTLVDQSWEKILTQINKYIPYILITFDEEQLKFSIAKILNCERLFTNTEDALKFLRIAKYKDKTIEQVIYNEIKNFKQNSVDIFNKTITISHSKLLIQIEYSIYFSNKPTILLVFPEISNNNQGNNEIMKSRYENLLNILIKLCQMMQNKNTAQYNVEKIQKKLIIIKLIQDLNKQQIKAKIVDLQRILSSLHLLYQKKKITISNLLQMKIQTCPSIFSFFLISIMEALYSNDLYISISIKQEQYIEFNFQGSFYENDLISNYKALAYEYSLIMKNLMISQNILSCIRKPIFLLKYNLTKLLRYNDIKKILIYLINKQNINQIIIKKYISTQMSKLDSSKWIQIDIFNRLKRQNHQSKCNNSQKHLYQNRFSFIFLYYFFKKSCNQITSKARNQLLNYQVILTPKMMNSESEQPPERAIINTEIEDVNKTVKVAEAAALGGLIPVSNQSGVNTTPPPNPTRPPKKPAYRLDFTVISNTELIFPSAKSYPIDYLYSSSFVIYFLYLQTLQQAIPKMIKLKKWYPKPQQSIPSIEGTAPDPFNNVTTIIMIIVKLISVRGSIGQSLASFSFIIFNSFE
ncbi:unnamed protein product [Paramecium sonneborni]|uniref:Transmembrane protein n=1 Tax=Paramecium sonneborni TaxID=65129 RepID=A0A8S1RH12_9CILI|nr:unnamed protein product [Paramecium sonneborni]